jgi:(1->4)-alpha-D-glucan 1-alpha-D-glucosylmutase
MTERQGPTPAEARDIVEQIAAERRIPRATYRLQLHKNFTFADAIVLVPYLDELGVSDVYASPIFRARTDSTHGYDVVDHGQINPELGGEEGLNALVDALHQRGMGLIVDMVPNHMAINDPANRWWMDVLENGPASVHASFFDIDWDPVKVELAGKVLLPILGDQYGAILERGELKLAYADGAFFVQYWEHQLPIAPDTYDRILSQRLGDVVEALGEGEPHTQELQSIITAVHHLPRRTQLSPDEKAERNREKEVVKRRIAALYAASVEVRQAIDATIGDYNEGPDAADLMDDLLTDQAHRLAFWRVAAEEINYRRFFDINDMAAIRVERPEVFSATHDLLLKLVAEGKVTGVRIDHPDGLWAPTVYFRSLQDQYVARRARLLLGKGDDDADGDDSDEAIGARLTRILERMTGPTQWPMYVVAEKILSEREGLPATGLWTARRATTF